jgi:hypothetical protein
MSENEPRRVFVGYLPTADAVFVGPDEIDPVARLLADAASKLDREREAEAKALAARAADLARARNTRAARVARRFRRALQMFRGSR